MDSNEDRIKGSGADDAQCPCVQERRLGGYEGGNQSMHGGEDGQARQAKDDRADNVRAPRKN